MASKKVTRAMEEFVVNHRCDMSVRQLADELGLSKTTVQRIVRKAGAPAALQAPDPARPEPAPPVAGSELALLQEHAGMLRCRIRTARDQSVPHLSREYRETLSRITALEEREAPPAEEEVDPFDAACAGIA